nr:MAG TPA: hypothetical protein [Caudoviricetes sp.]DAN83361.1 MAG TPA: hypothetical protein [Caudoviricetes sp.]DAT59163.1 MAG TPA: hypothetical protein [Caudoviricetes sp.]DAV63108.1 MAG TPA: hypothetical protein [Caudoviricetes sp.]
MQTTKKRPISGLTAAYLNVPQNGCAKGAVLPPPCCRNSQPAT